MTNPPEAHLARYEPIFSRFPSLRHLQRFELIGFLIWRHGWTKGAEIGVCKATTSGFLLETFPELEMIGVDPFKPSPSVDREANYRTSLEVFAKYGKRARLIRDTSHEGARLVPPASLDFVFIDGNHGYEAVKQDIKDWLPKLKPSGMLLGHDYLADFKGVVQAVDEAFRGRHHVYPNTIWAIWKRDTGGGKP